MASFYLDRMLPRSGVLGQLVNDPNCSGQSDLRMKLLIFSHVPPPFHGQSYMVRMLVDVLRGDVRSAARGAEVEVFHVDARLSDSIENIGQAGFKKVLLLIKYCLRAVWWRVRHDVRNFYYVPAPGLRAAVYRDWIVMAFCRPFFPFVIYHWHAVGLGDWIETQARPWERLVSRWLLGRPELSIVLGEFNRRDALQLRSQHIAVVPNGIPDPCPEFDESLRKIRISCAVLRRQLLGYESTGGQRIDKPASDGCEFRVMFIGLCHRSKGLFDALDAIALANRRLQSSPLRISLAVAGGFWTDAERVEFESRIQRPDLTRDGTPLVVYKGFVSGESKQVLFRECDCLCFPTYYPAESFGLVVAEAMAWGMSVVATRWRTVPELLPSKYAGVVDIQSPEQVSEALIQMAGSQYDDRLRSLFLERYTDHRFTEAMLRVLLDHRGELVARPGRDSRRA